MAIKINAALPKALTFEINGCEFELKMSAKNLAKKAVKLQYGSVELTKAATPEEFDTAYENLEASVKDIITEMFGEGALDKMTGGQDVGVFWLNNIITSVCREAVSAQSDTISKKYA